MIRQETMMESGGEDISSILDGYREFLPYLRENFLEFLKKRTKEIPDEKKRKYIYSTACAFQCTISAYYDKIDAEEGEFEQIYSMMNPETNYRKDLGFNDEDFEALRDKLRLHKLGFIINDTKALETIADCADMIFEQECDRTMINRLHLL